MKSEAAKCAPPQQVFLFWVGAGDSPEYTATAEQSLAAMAGAAGERQPEIVHAFRGGAAGFVQRSRG